MSTATVDSVSGSDPDAMISRTVRALRGAYDVDVRVLARSIGVSRNALYNRLNGSASWGAAEVYKLAQFFNCEINDFYIGNIRIDANEATPRVVSHGYHPSSDNVVTLFPQLTGRDEIGPADHIGRTRELTRSAS